MGRHTRPNRIPQACTRLQTDERGAILVPAIVMGAILVSALFYVAAVGDAIVFRTQLQDAADVTAFESAAWHAGGMNTIVVLNILMSLALSFFVLYRLVEVILLGLMLVPMASGFAGDAFRQLATNEDKVARGLNVVMELSAGAQMGVSVAVPYLALYHAKTQPTAADTVWPLNTSLIPPIVVDNGLQRVSEIPPRAPEMGPAALPIEHDEFDKLCLQAARLWPDQAINVVERALQLDRFDFPLLGGAITGTLQSIIGVVLSAVVEGTDGAVCQPAKAIGRDLLGSALGGAAQDGCGAREQQERDEAAGYTSEGVEADPPPTWSNRQRRGCEAENLQTAQQENEQPRSATVSFETEPVKMWDLAANGNLFMHSWSYVHGKPKLFASDSRLVTLPSSLTGAEPGAGGTRAVVPHEDGTAMAEYYFERTGSWSSSAEGFDQEFATQAVATWRPQWTARLRRYRSAGEQLQATGMAYPVEKLDELQGRASELLGESLINLGLGFVNRGTPLSVDDNSHASNFLKEKIQELPFIASINSKLEGLINGARESTGLDALLTKYFEPRASHDPDQVH